MQETSCVARYAFPPGSPVVRVFIFGLVADNSGLSHRDFNYLCALALVDAQSSLSGAKCWNFAKTENGFHIKYFLDDSCGVILGRAPLYPGFDANLVKLPRSSYAGPRARLVVGTDGTTGHSSIVTNSALEVSYWFGSETRTARFNVDVT